MSNPYRTFNQLAGDSKKQKFNVPEIENLDHKREIIRKNLIVCINVGADWCSPCKHISPAYAMLCKKYQKPGHCAVVHEYLEKKLSREYDIRNIPTFLFFYRGGFYNKIVGPDLEKVERELSEMFNLTNSVQQQPQEVPQNSNTFSPPPMSYTSSANYSTYDHYPRSGGPNHGPGFNRGPNSNYQ